MTMGHMMSAGARVVEAGVDLQRDYNSESEEAYD